MLQGTFETLALTEVLGLLAQSRKTGALHLEVGSLEARVFFADGRCRGAEAGDLAGPVDTEDGLRSRLVDVCFALAQKDGGSFRFAAEEAAPWDSDVSVEVASALHALESLLTEWREIQAVIPSLEARPRLVDELGCGEIIIDAELWRLLVAIDGRRSVRDIVHRTGRSVLSVCHAVKDLVEQGAAAVVVPGPPVPTARRKEKAPEHKVVPEAPYGPDVDALAAFPDPFADAGEEPGADADALEALEAFEDLGHGDESEGARGETRDKGALLRLFSALRDA